MAVRAAVETVRGTFAALPATLNVNLPSTPVIVRGDAAALQQLCSNLLFNAAQALVPRGRAAVSLAVSGDSVELTIADSGIGIGATEMERLRTPYYSSKPNGTGLGLPIARQIVAGHDGTLTIESTSGLGTTIRVRLPGVNGSFTPFARDVQKNGAVAAVEYSRNV
jgi:signal transduction histidine kinase